MSNKSKVERAIWYIMLTHEDKQIVNEIMVYKHLLDLELGDEINEVISCKLMEILLRVATKWCVLGLGEPTSNTYR